MRFERYGRPRSQASASAVQLSGSRLGEVERSSVLWTPRAFGEVTLRVTSSQLDELIWYCDTLRVVVPGRSGARGADDRAEFAQFR